MTVSQTTPNSKPGKKTAESVADRLIKCAGEVELFHDQGGDAYATVPVRHHRETYAIRSRAFRRWLSRVFYRATKGVASAQSVTDAVAVFEGRALFDGKELPVYLRVAEYDGVVYLDLANETWQVVEIRPDGWRVIDDSPVKFRRPGGMKALPTPVPGGSINELRPFVNVASDEDFMLLVAFILVALRPVGPYFVLILLGEQGSAKSWLVRFVRQLVDPNISPLRCEQKDVRDLVIMAHNGWLIPLDNLSSLPHWLSDALCRLSTGGGFSTRELYTDSDEVIFSSSRPILLNSIEEFDTRGDLHDRSIRLTLPTIPDDQRRSERELSSAFDNAQARILGALLDGVSTALRNLDDVQLDEIPRMADAIEWVEAAAPAFDWEPGEFLAVYRANRAAGHDLALDASPVAPVLLSYIETLDGETRTGTATDLLTILNRHAGYEDEDGKPCKRLPKGWPSKSHVLGGLLRRIAPDLRAVGVAIEFDRETSSGRRRLITIGKLHRDDSPDGNLDSESDGPDSRNAIADGPDGSDSNLRFSEHAAKAGRAVYSI